MTTRTSHGTCTSGTTTFPHWIAAVLEIARVSDDDATAIVGRDRLHHWWLDGMTAAMAADSVASWVKLAKPQLRADAEADSLRARLAGARRGSE